MGRWWLKKNLHTNKTPKIPANIFSASIHKFSMSHVAQVFFKANMTLTSFAHDVSSYRRVPLEETRWLILVMIIIINFAKFCKRINIFWFKRTASSAGFSFMLDRESLFIIVRPFLIQALSLKWAERSRKSKIQLNHFILIKRRNFNRTYLKCTCHLLWFPSKQQ